MRRLFSTFADGLPGAGLLVLRISAGGALTLDAIETVLHGSTLTAIAHVLAAMAGLFLVIGLWTPMVGIGLALTEVWIMVQSSHDHLRSHLLQGALGIALAMIGPGVWSVDARLFGWRRLEIPTRKS